VARSPCSTRPDGTVSSAAAGGSWTTGRGAGRPGVARARAWARPRICQRLQTDDLTADAGGGCLPFERPRLGGSDHSRSHRRGGVVAVRDLRPRKPWRLAGLVRPRRRLRRAAAVPGVWHVLASYRRRGLRAMELDQLPTAE